MRIEIPQRTDVLLRIRPTIDGEPVPLDNVTVEFAVSSLSGKRVIGKEGETVDDRVAVGITHDESDIPATVYRCEVRVTDIEGGQFQIGRGQFVVTPSIFGRDDDDGISDNVG